MDRWENSVAEKKYFPGGLSYPRRENKTVNGTKQREPKWASSNFKVCF